mmetsp:Transcript_31938/g.39153  ORF Transcript_31938/g.39153 Transcript_31938/m.39153 type:complete len:290 (+) Transcript_31938:112-981(+)|eukprot:CAMPEP_0172495714 /NCGR_PEP_ID=MMETSP1066-20121228/75021_1 /TAXON_ID=671091 /ORGANISM="Coscinodiscus wailesii, Strain CCMP2513" /LENGTH=289 /DNA_ID=CAMNT_0013267561 /DNA_START=111 /DNA_END=980 /DNA_ORIENTATION=+
MSTQVPPLSKASYDLSGRTFLVTGGTQGLGLEIARHLKQLGAKGLILASRSSDRGQKACDELDDDTCTCVHVVTDLGKAEEASSLVARGVTRLAAAAKTNGGETAVLSGVVNCAAITARGNLFTTTADGFDAQMALNVRAPFLVTQAAAKHMLEKGVTNGSIVNVCSTASYGGAPFIMAYSAAKSALVTLTKNNAAELAPKGIRVNAVNMGWCLTENEDKLQKAQTGDEAWAERADRGVPLGRILRPADVAVTVAFLLSDASVMMSGSAVELHPDFPHGMLSLLDEDVR